MKTGPLWLLYVLSGIAAMYLGQVFQFKKYWRVEINGYRISPWVCSAVFMFWILGMAVSIYMIHAKFHPDRVAQAGALA